MNNMTLQNMKEEEIHEKDLKEKLVFLSQLLRVEYLSFSYK